MRARAFCPTEWQFYLRDRYFGRVRVRRKLPRLIAPLTETPEHRFYQLILSKIATPDELAQAACVLDIGARNGSYLPALARSCPRARVIGVELDGGRRYWNGYRRADYGDAFAEALRTSGRDASYVWGDIRNLSAGTLALPHKGLVFITLFYPFVSEAPCTGWGLPARYADYLSVVEHLRRIAREIPEADTRVISVHQGPWEADLARRTYESMSLETEERRVERAEFSSLWPSEHDALVFRTHLR